MDETTISLVLCLILFIVMFFVFKDLNTTKKVEKINKKMIFVFGIFGLILLFLSVFINNYTFKFNEKMDSSGIILVSPTPSEIDKTTESQIIIVNKNKNRKVLCNYKKEGKNTFNIYNCSNLIKSKESGV